jgi:hypothetical protein
MARIEHDKYIANAVPVDFSMPENLTELGIFLYRWVRQHTVSSETDWLRIYMQHNPWMNVWMQNKRFLLKPAPLYCPDDTEKDRANKTCINRWRLIECEFVEYDTYLGWYKAPKDSRSWPHEYRDVLLVHLILCARSYAYLVIAERNGSPGVANLSGVKPRSVMFSFTCWRNGTRSRLLEQCRQIPTYQQFIESELRIWAQTYMCRPNQYKLHNFHLKIYT